MLLSMDATMNIEALDGGGGGGGVVRRARAARASKTKFCCTSSCNVLRQFLRRVLHVLVLHVLPKGSVGAACVCWAWIPVLEEDACHDEHLGGLRRCVFYSPSSSLGLIDTHVLAAAAGLLALRRRRRRDPRFRKSRARLVVIFPRQNDCLHHGHVFWILRVVQIRQAPLAAKVSEADVALIPRPLQRRIFLRLLLRRRCFFQRRCH